MSDDKKKIANSSDQRSDYQSPKLTVFGDVKCLTAAGSLPGEEGFPADTLTPNPHTPDDSARIRRADSRCSGSKIVTRTAQTAHRGPALPIRWSQYCQRVSFSGTWRGVCCGLVPSVRIEIDHEGSHSEWRRTFDILHRRPPAWVQSRCPPHRGGNFLSYVFQAWQTS